MYLGLGAAAAALLLVVLFLPGMRERLEGPELTTSEGAVNEQQPRETGPSQSNEESKEADEPRVSESYPDEEKPPGGTALRDQRRPDQPRPARPRREQPRPDVPRPEPEIRGSLAVVIDDVGNSLSDLDAFLALDIPLTFAVLPRREYSREAAVRAAAAGHEVILHLPMQPVSDMDPGPGAIRVGMGAADIREAIRGNLETVPGIRGVNNHMGSRVTADPDTMNMVLQTLKEEGLFFLDSRTSAHTVGRLTAEQHNLPYLERAVFLDNESNRDYIRNAVREGMEIAERKGHAVMIGHVMVNELVEVLNEMYPFIQDEGFDLRYLSELVLTPEFDDDPRS
jgi:polysaccharide deacetylase 2 family uncharacterized protein YibQ